MPMMNIYEATCDQVFMLCASTREDAMNQVPSHWRFGPIGETPYTKGDKWACSNEPRSGWDIRELYVDVAEVIGHIKGDPQHEAAHVIWTCPLCGEERSEDLEPDDALDFLWYCQCKGDQRNYFTVKIVPDPKGVTIHTPAA